ncbi:MAG: hypothetical protein K5829_08685 [Treponema sp.]|nr:hypothetical protein [Treponema sp.]
MNKIKRLVFVAFVSILFMFSSCAIKRGYYDFAGACISPSVVHIDEPVEICIMATEVTDYNVKRQSYLTFTDNGEEKKYYCEDNINIFTVKFEESGWHDIVFHGEYENSGYIESDYNFMLYVHKKE